MLLAIVHDITERKAANEALQAIVNATAGSGPAFFQALVSELAVVLRVKYVLIGTLVHEETELIRTLAVWADGAFAPNLEYPWAGSPCAYADTATLCYYPDGVQGQFPQDEFLAAMGVASYLGIPLMGASGSILGVLAVLHDQPMANSELARSLLTIFASRAAMEMERQRSEEEIRHLLDQVREDSVELENRVAERTVQLKEANAELEAFAYSVSHDLKAPLRGIDGYSQLLEMDYAGRLDDEGRLLISNVRSGAAQMNQLIEDLLDYSRMERRALQSVSLDLPALVQAVVAERAEEIEKAGVQLRLEIPLLTVRADRDGLAIVLRNLLENAVKFSREARPPKLEIGARVEDNRVILWVRDNGMGFDMKFHDRIFEIFQRLQRTEEYPGTGIGLALVRKAMQRMGGRVWAESAPGEGATFFLEILT